MWIATWVESECVECLATWLVWCLVWSNIKAFSICCFFYFNDHEKVKFFAKSPNYCRKWNRFASLKSDLWVKYFQESFSHAKRYICVSEIRNRSKQQTKAFFLRFLLFDVRICSWKWRNFCDLRKVTTRRVSEHFWGHFDVQLCKQHLFRLSSSSFLLIFNVWSKINASFSRY